MLLFNNIDITRNSSDSTGGDNSSFYGVGAALLATDGNAYVKGGTVTTDAARRSRTFLPTAMELSTRQTLPLRQHRILPVESMQPAAVNYTPGI